MTNEEKMMVEEILEESGVYEQERFDKLTQEQREYIFQHSEYAELSDSLNFDDPVAVELTEFLLNYFTLDTIEARYKAVFGEEYSRDSVAFFVVLYVCGDTNYSGKELSSFIYDIYPHNPEQWIGEDDDYDCGYAETNLYLDDLLQCLSDYDGNYYDIPSQCYCEGMDDEDYDYEDILGEDPKTFWESHGI